MQYKIPVQIENEDVIVAWLSLRQLAIMMGGAGLTYGIFRSLQGSFPPVIALIIAAPPAVIGIIVALMKIAEMTFLPIFLNFIRLNLNGKERIWSQGTDSYTEIDIGYVPIHEVKENKKIVLRDPLSLEMEDARKNMKKL